LKINEVGQVRPGREKNTSGNLTEIFHIFTFKSKGKDFYSSPPILLTV
jgi:hypothetical protein